VKAILAIAILCIVSLSLSVRGTTLPSSEPAENEVRAAEAARTTALLYVDLPALDKRMADDVT
jgi:hypothetical protein